MVSEVTGSTNTLVSIYDGTNKVQGGKRTDATTGTGTPPASGEQVSLTAEVGRLQNLEQAVREASPVDETRVNAIQQDVADGTYNVDDQQTADKLIATEKSLPRADTGEA